MCFFLIGSNFLSRSSSLIERVQVELADRIYLVGTCGVDDVVDLFVLVFK